MCIDFSFFFKQKTAYELRISDWSSDVCSSDLALALSPDESLVLNYLGYSWVDQGANLKQAMDYIRKAVKLKPDDGRSEVRRVGKEGVRMCRTRGSPDH